MEFWSAVTCHRFYCLADLSVEQRRAERRDKTPHARDFVMLFAPPHSTATSRLRKAVTSHRTPKLDASSSSLKQNILAVSTPTVILMEISWIHTPNT